MGKKSRRNRSEKPQRVRIKFVARPFADLPQEAELVAMREILPAAMLPAKTSSAYGEEEFFFVTQLPKLAAAMRRSDGKLLIALQTVMQSGNAALDLADRLRHGLALAAGASYQQSQQPTPGIELSEMLDLEFPGQLEIVDDFHYCFTDAELQKPEIEMALQQGKESVVPMEEVPGVPRAYLAKMQKEFLRWVRPEEEEAVLAGLARLQQKRQLEFAGGRFLGAFRALGLLIPVFEIAAGQDIEETAKAVQDFAPILSAAIASDEPLNDAEKRAKAGIISRQVTLR